MLGTVTECLRDPCYLLSRQTDNRHVIWHGHIGGHSWNRKTFPPWDERGDNVVRDEWSNLSDMGSMERWAERQRHCSSEDIRGTTWTNLSTGSTGQTWEPRVRKVSEKTLLHNVHIPKYITPNKEWTKGKGNKSSPPSTPRRLYIALVVSFKVVWLHFPFPRNLGCTVGQFGMLHPSTQIIGLALRNVYC